MMKSSYGLEHTTRPLPSFITKQQHRKYRCNINFPPTKGSAASLVIKQEIRWRLQALARFKKSIGVSEFVKHSWRPKHLKFSTRFSLSPSIVNVQNCTCPVASLCSNCWFQWRMLTRHVEPMWSQLSECSDTNFPHFWQYEGMISVLK